MTRSGRAGVWGGLTQHLVAALHHLFVEQPSDMAVTGHAPRSGAAGLRNGPDGLGLMLGDCIANFMFGDIQAVTERPLGSGHGVVEVFSGKIHVRLCGMGERRSDSELEIQSQLIGELSP